MVSEQHNQAKMVDFVCACGQGRRVFVPVGATVTFYCRACGRGHKVSYEALKKEGR